MLVESIVLSQQQKSAADQIDAAVRQIRDEHDALAIRMKGQRMRLVDRIEALVADIDINRGALTGVRWPGVERFVTLVAPRAERPS
jgi:hypothetical protein